MSSYNLELFPEKIFIFLVKEMSFYLNPRLWTTKPAIVGPRKFPKWTEEVHTADIIRFIFMSSVKPWYMASR